MYWIVKPIYAAGCLPGKIKGSGMEAVLKRIGVFVIALCLAALSAMPAAAADAFITERDEEKCSDREVRRIFTQASFSICFRSRKMLL